MSQLDKRIIKFINEHHVLTLATVNNNKPYCANCFYVYLEEYNCLVFTSDEETKHATDFMSSSYVAGSIVLETKIVYKIQGIQFNGYVRRPDKDLLKFAKKRYLKKFPIANIMKTDLWILDLSFIKMTHNMLGFGNKLIWEKKVIDH